MTKFPIPQVGVAATPPKGIPWAWLPRELLLSPAWRSLGINARRLIDTLLIEHMSHGGRQNGRLKATHRQLVEAGMSVRLVAEAIREAEAKGLIDCARGGRRVASCFALTWMSLHDGTPASNRWQAAAATGAGKNGNLPSQGEAALPSVRKAKGPNLPSLLKAKGP
jgi:hypothetical protein